MPTLKIDLQEGFSGKSAVLRINGKEVYRGTPRTRTQIGLAESRSFDLPRQKIAIQLELPESNKSQETALNLDQDQYVGISLTTTGEISFNLAAEPFGY
ncbi:MAG TPA: hypothetical protein VFR18_10960, partial [Terriglobia bacterium]|nr:hypothetical protein [Terriglobia bacterium]